MSTLLNAMGLLLVMLLVIVVFGWIEYKMIQSIDAEDAAAAARCKARNARKDHGGRP